MTVPGGGQEQQDLGRKVKTGVWWSLLNTGFVRVGTFATSILLARTVFGPEAFGLYAVSQTVLAVLLSANEMGVALALVRWEGDVRAFAGTVFTLAVASSTLLYGLLFLSAPFIATTLGSHAATGLVRVLSLCVIIDGLACVPLMLLTRSFAQRSLMIVNALTFVVNTVVTLVLAFSGVGPISFAYGAVAGGLVTLIGATIAAPFKVLPGWNPGQARKLLRFGLPLGGASLLVLGVFNVDSMIVGATLGPTALGLYQLAYNISAWPTRSISEIAKRVSFATFSRVTHSAELLTDAFCRAVALVMAATVPAAVLLAVLADPLIQLVYGQRWLPAAPALVMLAILGLLRDAYAMAYDMLSAADKRPTLMVIQGWWLAALIPVLLVCARTRGIVGVGGGHVLVAAVLVTPAYLWGLSRCKVRLRSVLAACLRPFLGGVFMTAACELALRAVGQGIAGVAAATAVGFAVYLPVVWPMREMLGQTGRRPRRWGKGYRIPADRPAYYQAPQSAAASTYRVRAKA